MLEEEPVLELCISSVQADDFWTVNGQRTTEEKCLSKYEEATNGGYGYRMYRYDRKVRFYMSLFIISDMRTVKRY